MLAAQSPFNPVHHILRPRSGRKPLQPRNIPACTANDQNRPKAGQQQIAISPIGSVNKENDPVYMTPRKIEFESKDASLAEELSAVREKLERLRVDRERTERLLKERDLVLDLQMNELKQRGQIQKELEIEVDRLYRLKQIQVACMRTSPIRSLREREMEKKTKEVLIESVKPQHEESTAHCAYQSPSVDTETASCNMTSSAIVEFYC
ncbi:hypothetical protein Nepgr_031956 [Nepenthes gracilis]|uniref:High mobility group B protein 6 n=1 Tax=Nepenthes gracilis TaxID=150966 RepID=A0AAD3TJL6_NEPGR|nr:hypothetical protein Nepgr_031956 [Nepenthes gracilis]